MPTIHHFVQNIETDLGLVSKENAHHIIAVLRLGLGDEIVFTDGQTSEWQTKITSLSPLRVKIIAKKIHTISEPYITLIVSTIKPRLIDLVIEKSTELAVDRIIITKTIFSQIPLNKIHQKSTRFHAIIEAAMKQSHRIKAPELDIMEFSEIFSNLSSHNLVATTQYCENPIPLLNSIETKYDSIGLFIGPEGGFSEKEFDKIKELFTPVSLGSHVLRAETAAIVGGGILSQLKIG